MNSFKAVKKPIEVEVLQFATDEIGFKDMVDDTKILIKELEEFCKPRKFFINDKGEAIVETLEGNHKVSIGDYIIKGVKGECYPCKPDIFKATYNYESDL